VEEEDNGGVKFHREGEPVSAMLLAISTKEERNKTWWLGCIIVVPEKECTACIVNRFAAMVTLEARFSDTGLVTIKDKRHRLFLVFGYWCICRNFCKYIGRLRTKKG
jgi:hypothetical protein